MVVIKPSVALFTVRSNLLDQVSRLKIIVRLITEKHLEKIFLINIIIFNS